MKKILKKSLHILCTTLGIIPFMLTSCNYLAVDEYFNDLTPLDSIFARQDYLERYVWGTAALMPAQGNLFSGSYGPYETAVDEVLLSWQKAEYAGTYLYADKITQNDSYYNMWGQYYKGIRKCNTIFARIDECKDLKGLDRREIMGLTHFMRASFYFYLLELYGPAVILPEEPLSVDENIKTCHSNVTRTMNVWNISAKTSKKLTVYWTRRARALSSNVLPNMRQPPSCHVSGFIKLPSGTTAINIMPTGPLPTDET